jgi:hypothetical protein
VVVNLVEASCHVVMTLLLFPVLLFSDWNIIWYSNQIILFHICTKLCLSFWRKNIRCFLDKRYEEYGGKNKHGKTKAGRKLHNESLKNVRLLHVGNIL